jgi:hypothetical protein
MRDPVGKATLRRALKPSILNEFAGLAACGGIMSNWPSRMIATDGACREHSRLLGYYPRLATALLKLADRDYERRRERD